MITDLIHTNVPSSQTNPTSPPPINWSTKPNRYPQETGILDGSQGPFTNTLPADSVADGSSERRQLALLLRHLGHSVRIVDATSQQDDTDHATSQQDGTDSHGVQPSDAVSNTVHELEAALHELESKDAFYSSENETSDF